MARSNPWPTKDFKVGQHPCDLQVWVRWIPSFDLQGPAKMFASLHAVACAMCHQSTHDRHHRRSGISALRMVPRRSRSDWPFGRYSRKGLPALDRCLSRTPLTGGGRITPPPPQANSQTNDRSETGEAALERSRQDGSKTLLKFLLKGHVSGQGQVKGQNWAFLHFGSQNRQLDSNRPKLGRNTLKG